MRTTTLIIAAVLAAGFAAPAGATLAPGAAAPDFTAPSALDGHESSFSLASALKKGPVVLYFYPKAFTKGCSLEAHAFADAIDQYKAMGATVVGVSRDDIKTLDRFSTSECQSKFPVASDQDGKVVKAYDAALPMVAMSNRTSYVIAPDGKVIYTYSNLDYAKHVENTLAALKDWRATHKA